VGETAAPSQRSLFALSWLNFFLSGMQTAFGPVAAAYLAAQEWTARDIGFVLSIGGIASLARTYLKITDCCRSAINAE